MKKKYIILTIGLVILLLLGILFLFKYKIITNPYFINISYNELIEKINNKDTFALCVSRVNCSHCKSYKPKLNKITKDYNIIIYYTDIDKYTKKEYESFKEKISFDGGTPTTIFFKEGEEKTTATRIEGDASLEKIVNKLKQNGFITE